MKNFYDIKFKTRYAETDQMGYIHHSIYAQYFEMGRIEFMNHIGISYKQMEKEGVILPVYTLNTKYISPLTFDELITVRTYIRKLEGVRLVFGYEIFNSNNIKTTEAEVVLVFAGSNGKPVKPPYKYLEILRKYI